LKVIDDNGGAMKLEWFLTLFVRPGPKNMLLDFLRWGKAGCKFEGEQADAERMETDVFFALFMGVFLVATLTTLCVETASQTRANPI